MTKYLHLLLFLQFLLLQQGIRLSTIFPFCFADPESGAFLIFDRTPGYERSFFLIPDFRSRILTPYFWELSNIFGAKKCLILLCLLAQFFSVAVQNKIIFFYFVKFMATKEYKTIIFSPYFIVVVGSRIWDSGSATLLPCTDFWEMTRFEPTVPRSSWRATY